MGRFKNFIPALFGGLALILLVQAQDQSSFISIDCGLAANSSYSEPTTGVIYISDATYIDTGVSKSIPIEFKDGLQQQVWTLRSFPQGIRNCYSINNITQGTKYIIRANFFYGNYDGQGNLPEFDLHFEPNLWDTIKIENISLSVIKELIHVPSLNHIQVCLVNTGLGTPFISALELRPINSSSYVTNFGSLSLFLRSDLGSEKGYRYKDDVYDRYWSPYDCNYWKALSTSLTVDSERHNAYWVPYVVMSTAATPINESAPMKFYQDQGSLYDQAFPDAFDHDVAATPIVHSDAPKKSSRVSKPLSYLKAYHCNQVSSASIANQFQSVVKLRTNESRSFNITINGELWYGPLSPRYLSTDTVYSTAALTGGKYVFSILKTGNSTLPPIINAIEIYTVKDLSQSETDQQDVAKVDLEPSVQNQSLESIQRQFAYPDLLRITNNFERILGKGGFGTVFHGCIDDTQVAVKMLSASSVQGYQQFQAEASNYNLNS
nr:isoform 2 of probable lrr receptor-like protein kinase [Quercus suber]